ncbi:DUF3307 domain-containing protein [Kitasatospora sp. NPDC056783]|uniref:DUF3307 domain-containing protein n=1 Tax=Kitasatospora sp. NPDC056783 TaxID=3345943 RepID=UPI0036C236CA
MAAKKSGWTEGLDDRCPGRYHHGWGHNLLHAFIQVITTTVVLLAAGPLVLEHQPSWCSLAAGLAWIGMSHAAIDRRRGVRWWMEHTGQRGYLAAGGLEKVDQAAHFSVGLLPAALFLTLIR